MPRIRSSTRSRSAAHPWPGSIPAGDIARYKESWSVSTTGSAPERSAGSWPPAESARRPRGRHQLADLPAHAGGRTDFFHKQGPAPVRWTAVEAAQKIPASRDPLGGELVDEHRPVEPCDARAHVRAVRLVWHPAAAAERLDDLWQCLGDAHHHGCEGR
jgi:hypothetical protein